MSNILLPKATELHQSVIQLNRQYEETSHWHPVIVTRANHTELHDFLCERGLVRGTPQARNDYLNPLTHLFLFKDYKIAIEVKLRWG